MSILHVFKGTVTMMASTLTFRNQKPDFHMPGDARYTFLHF